MPTLGVALVLVVLTAAVVAAWVVSLRLVGAVAEEFGEDPARWRLLMLPFGVFGPVIARAVAQPPKWRRRVCLTLRPWHPTCLFWCYLVEPDWPNGHLIA